jgi:hypothetical protein
MAVLANRRQEESRAFHLAERDRLRRIALHRKLGALENERDRVLRDHPFKWQQRAARLVNLIVATTFALNQLELPL